MNHEENIRNIRRAQLDQLLAGGTNMAGGGLLKAVAKAAKPALKAVQEVLPLAEREANLAKFLAPSAEKRKMYHGSKEPNIKEFKTRKDLTDESHMTGHYADERDAVFLAPEPEFTKNFSQMGYTDTHQAPTTYPVYVQAENPFDFDNPEHLQRVKDTYLDMYHNPDSEFYDPYLSPSERSTSQHLFKKRVDELPTDENNWPRIENKEFQNVLKDLGFDSFYTRERGTKNLGVYDPNRIKSAIGNRGTYDLSSPDINEAQGGLVHLAGGGDPRKRGLFPKMSMQAIVNSPGFDPEVPSDLSRAYARRMAEKEAYQRSMADQKLTPAQRAVAGAEATGMLGSAMFEGVQQLPKLMDGEDAYTKAVGERMYQPRFQPEKAAEYAGNVGDFLEKLETDYKMPQLLPELLPFTGAAETAKQQAKKAVKQGALTAASRMNAGPKAGSMAAQRGAVKLGGGNWVDTELQRSLGKLKQDDSYPQIYIDSAKKDLAEYEKNPDMHPEAATQAEILKRDIAHMEQVNAFNKWVDTKAGSYIRNQMATPDDPVLKMLDARTAKIEADYQAGQQRLAKLDERIAQAPTSTQEERNTLANLQRTRAQRAAELESDRELAMNSMLPGGKDNAGYEYLNNDIDRIKEKREKAGFLAEGYAQSEPAKAWEAAQDINMVIKPAAQFQNQEKKLAALRAAEKELKQYENVELSEKFKKYLEGSGFDEATKQRLFQGSPKSLIVDMIGDNEKSNLLIENYNEARNKVNASLASVAEENPYLTKLPPNTPVYRSYLPDLGIDHILDVLKDDVATGKLKLEDLNKITMDQAVKRAAEYDFEMAKKSRDAVAQSRASMPVYKEYPEGYKWVQLTKPGEFNAESNEMGHSVRGYEPERGHPDWTPESGDSGSEYYGHGGWEAIKSGEAKVYSLVDPSGKPHATIEVKANPNSYPVSGEAFAILSPEKRAQFREHVMQWRRRNPNVEELTDEQIVQALKEAGVPPQPDIITQIKGKGNARPSEKYDPYTQDFVRSSNWDEVGDLRNTGLKTINEAFPNYEDAKRYGKSNPNAKYLTQAEIDAHNKEVNEELLNEFGRHRIKPDPESKKTLGKTDFMTVRELAELEFPNDLQRQANMIRGSLQGETEPGPYSGIIHPPLEENGMAGGGLLSKIGKAAKAARAAEELVPAAGRMKFADQPRGGLNIIKETGGNWLGGDVEKQLKRLQMGDTVPKQDIEKLKGDINTAKRVTGRDATVDRAIRQMENELDTQTRNNALNAWVESNLTNYVKKQMGTAEDPVRKLAEQGILHMEPFGNVDAGRLTMKRRAGLGYPYQGVGESDKAKFWERSSDASIDPYPAGAYKHGSLDESILANNPWLQNVPDETMINSSKGLARELGFDHILDVLRQDVREGRIRPEQLSKVSMEQAVRRTYEYDQEMAKKMREAQAKVTEGMPVHKEYPEGYKWIELAQPKVDPKKELPQGFHLEDTEDGLVVMNDRTGEIASPELAAALKYEGETMGHCVGGYCPDVVAGRSRIYSLRDAKGEPHVTVEVKPHEGWFTKADKTPDPTGKNKSFHELIDNERSELAQQKGGFGNIGESYEDTANRLANQYKLETKPTIVQIKGKQNRAPKEEYLPFVQDFVKGGDWSDVGDLQNTGLKVYKGNDGVKYVTPEEYNIELQKELGLSPPEEGMAGGGSVGLRNALNNLLRTDKPEAHMSGGGVMAKVAKAAEATAKAAKAAEYLPGVHYADPLMMPTMKMSEALGNAGAEGKTLNFTETDRSRVFGPNRGGAGFSGLQHYSLPHQEANTVWGFGNKTTAEKKIRQNDPENTIWTTYAGSPNQHKSNTIVVKDALSQLQSADSQGLVNPKQIEFINDRIRSSVGQNGNPLFPKDFDITDPKAFDYATTFDRRAAISDALMGVGVKKPMISKEFKAANPGVKWSDAANIDAILRRETDPAMLDANTFDVGPHLFTMDNGIIERPDLNEAFPYQVTGTDLGLRYELAPMRAAAPDWVKARNIKPDEPINAWAMSRAEPKQFVSEDYLTSLQKQGKKKGGLAQTKKVKRHGNTVPH